MKNKTQREEWKKHVQAENDRRAKVEEDAGRKLEAAMDNPRAKAPPLTEDQRKFLRKRCSAILELNSPADSKVALREIVDSGAYLVAAGNFDEFCVDFLAMAPGESALAYANEREVVENYSGSNAAKLASNDGTVSSDEAVVQKKSSAPKSEAKANDGSTIIKSTLPSEAVLLTDTTPEYWMVRINDGLSKTVGGFIQVGRDLIEAKAKLGHGGFNTMFGPGGLKINQRTAELLMRVARHPAISNPNNYSILPPTLNALNKLSDLPAEGLQKAIDDGKVTPSMTIREARELICKSSIDITPERSAKDDAKKCDRGLKVLGTIVKEAMCWRVDQRERFISESKKLVEALKNEIAPT
jgi:hypothetical protein